MDEIEQITRFKYSVGYLIRNVEWLALFFSRPLFIHNVPDAHFQYLSRMEPGTSGLIANAISTSLLSPPFTYYLII